MKKRILSGMRPTGRLHLGNYFGALENWVKLQDEYDCHYFVADWHALTTGYENTSDLKNNVYDVVLDWLSAGLDPEKSVIFVQSDIKEHAELYLAFSMITPLSWLYRCPTYKEQLNQLKEKNITTFGFLGYPCLQAADILIYKADAVPVGEDQLPHLELTREIGRRFNYLYGNLFPEPQALLTESKVLPGLDGRKMSKSYGNTIALSDSPEDIFEKVRGMITDPSRIKKTDPGHPDICTVFAFHKVFNTDGVKECGENCRGGKIGCVQCKKMLANKMIENLEPIYTKRKALEINPSYVREVIALGAEKARKTAMQTLQEIKEKIGMSYE
jgi:tryptophanyl-tRNA synthetase